MRKKLIAIRALTAIALALALAVSAPAAMSQSIQAEIPFAFAIIGGKLMPAGRYTIEQTASAATLRIVGENGSSAMATLPCPPERIAGWPPELVFDRSAGVPRLAAARYSAPNRATGMQRR